jgi:hypothetical protein
VTAARGGPTRRGHIDRKVAGIECPACGTRLFSWHVHDFKYCACGGGGVFIDGGREYMRFCWLPDGRKPKRIFFDDRKDVRP